MPKQRVFEVLVLRHFSNFKVLKRIIVVADARPLPCDLGLKEKDEVMEIRELQAEVVIK